MKRIRDIDLDSLVARVFHATDATRRIAVDQLIQMELPKVPSKGRGLRIVRNHLLLALGHWHSDRVHEWIARSDVLGLIRTQSHPEAGELPPVQTKNGRDATPHLQKLVAERPDLGWDPEAVQAAIIESIRQHGDHEVDDALPPWLRHWGPAAGAPVLWRLVTLRKLGELPGTVDVHEQRTYDEAREHFERTKNIQPSNLVAPPAKRDTLEAMNDPDRLLAAVIAAPTDPAPRRAYADAVRPRDAQRAELIDLQLAIREARRSGGAPPSAATNRARALAHGRGKEWAYEIAELVQDLTYLGGFVELVRVTPAQLISAAAALTRLAPLRHLTLRGLHDHVGAIAQLSILAQLVSLDVNSCQLTDAEISALVASPHLRGLRLLRINNNPIGIEALRAIARADLPELRYVETMETDAPLLDRGEDAGDGSVSASFTRLQETLAREFPDRAWLRALDEPSLDVL